MPSGRRRAPWIGSNRQILQQNLHLHDLAGLDRLSGLQELVITLSPELESLNGVNTAGLQSLALYANPVLTDSSAASALIRLDSLVVYETGLRDLSAFTGLRHSRCWRPTTQASLASTSAA